jgi:malate dehydrogenase
MSFVAIVGSGALGGAVAHALALRDRVAEVRLIDSNESIARGKALDILQSSPIDRFGTRVAAADRIDAAAGASVIVIADSTSNDEHAGEEGLALLRRLIRVGGTAPVLCAGALQRDLIARAVSELGVPRTRIIGSAPFALESAMRALVGLAVDGSGVEVSLRVFGVPPRGAFAAWADASAHGQPLTAQLPPHAMAALSARIPRLWPQGPYALGTAAARVAEALVHGSRRRFTCFVALEAGSRRAAVAAMPVQLRRGGVDRVVEPLLTRQEKTLLENAIEKA